MLHLHTQKKREQLKKKDTEGWRSVMGVITGTWSLSMNGCQMGNRPTLCVIYGHAITHSHKSNSKALHKTPHSSVQNTHFDLMTHYVAYTQLGAHASVWAAYGLRVGRALAVVWLWTGPCICCFTTHWQSVYILFNKSLWSTSAFPSLTHAAFPFPLSCSIRGLPFCLFCFSNRGIEGKQSFDLSAQFNYCIMIHGPWAKTVHCVIQDNKAWLFWHRHWCGVKMYTKHTRHWKS